MDDKTTTIKDIKTKARKYREARGWSDGDPKDIAIGLVLEATEVLELVQWRQGDDLTKNKRLRGMVADELSDILWWTVVMAERLDLDLSHAFEIKVKKQEEKYPVEVFNNPNLSKEEKRRIYYQIKAQYRGNNPIEE